MKTTKTVFLVRFRFNGSMFGVYSSYEKAENAIKVLGESESFNLKEFDITEMKLDKRHL